MRTPPSRHREQLGRFADRRSGRSVRYQLAPRERGDDCENGLVFVSHNRVYGIYVFIHVYVTVCDHIHGQ